MGRHIQDASQVYWVQQQPVCSVLLESQRRDYRQLMPTDNEISTAEELVAVLEAVNDATEIVSGEKYPTIGIVKPLLHKLLSSTLAAKDTDNALTKSIKNVLGS